jgi:hypothetical protein
VGRRRSEDTCRLLHKNSGKKTMEESLYSAKTHVFTQVQLITRICLYIYIDKSTWNLAADSRMLRFVLSLSFNMARKKKNPQLR